MNKMSNMCGTTKEELITEFVSSYDIYKLSPKLQYTFGLLISKLENFNDIQTIKGAISLFKKEILPLFALSNDQQELLDNFDKKYIEFKKDNRKEMQKFLDDDTERLKLEN